MALPPTSPSEVAPGDAIEAPKDRPPPSAGRRALTGAMWTAGGYGAQQVLRLGGNIVLCHLLWPEAFGIMALVKVFLHGLQMLSDIGIRGSIIYHRSGEDPDFLNTAWTVKVIRGFILWGVCCAAAWPMAAVYGRPELLELLPVAGLVAVIDGLSSVSIITHQRRLAVSRVVRVDLVAQFVQVITMITWAWISPSVWALLAGGIAGALVRAFLSHTTIATIRNRFRLDPRAYGELFHFGKWVFLGTLATYVAGRLDRWLLGGLLSFEVLGIYSIALTLAMLPTHVVSRVSQSVLHPLLAESARSGRKELARRLREARRMILPVGLAASLAVGLFAPAFFAYLYPDEFAGAGWMAQLLSLTVWFLVLQHSSDRVLLAMGESRATAGANAVNAVVTTTGCVAGYYFAGLVGLILGNTLGNLAGQAVIQALLARRGIRIWKTDAAYTAVLLGVLAVGAFFPRAIADRTGWSWETITLICGVPLVGAAAVFALRSVFPRIRAAYGGAAA